MSIRSGLIALALAFTACEHPSEWSRDDVDGRRPGSPTLTPAAQRQGDTLGGADSVPVKTVDSAGPSCAVTVDPTTPDSPTADHFVAVLHGTAAHPEVSGVVHFRRSGAGVAVEMRAEGLPAGNHGLEVHQYGDCSDPQNSAGPRMTLAKTPANAGQLAVLTATATGVAELRLPAVEVDREVGLLNGRAIVVHSEADHDAAIACGVLGVAASTSGTTIPTDTLDR